LRLQPLRAVLGAAAVLCVLAAAPAVASATPYVLFGATGGGGPAPTTSDLYRIDPATGASTTVGPIGQSLTGMAYDPLTGVVYGVTTGSSACARCLVTVNTSTGASTVVGELDRGGNPANVDTISELAFRADGTLFGWSENGDDLARIDLATGATAHVSDAGISTFGDAMDFTRAGTLYVFPEGDDSTYYTVDPATGQPTPAGTVINAPLTPQCDGGAPLSAGSIDPSTGTFYASRIDNCGGPQPFAADLLTIDLATGEATRIGDLPPQTDAIEFVPAPDLAVAKSAPASATSGGTISYGLTVHNNGAGDALNATLTDALPAGTTFVSATQTAGPAFSCSTPPTGSGGTVSCTAGRFADGATAAFTVVVRTSSAAPAGTVSNTASIGSSSLEGDASNNSATATTSISPQADVGVTKSGAPKRVRVGDVVHYTITATDHGPSDAQSVVVRDALPTGTTFVSAAETSGPASTCTKPHVGKGGTVRCTIATLPAGAAATFEVALKVGGGAVSRSTLRNTATVSSSTPDGSTANNRAHASSRTLAAQLSLTAHAARSKIVAGQTDTYTFRVRSTRTAAVGMRVCDRLPSGMVFVSVSGARISGRTACWTVSRLGAGKSRTFTLRARAQTGTGGRLTNHVTASALGARTVHASVGTTVVRFLPTRSGGVTG
jgi:uncharacterized repeat protein (TIGR01451 family)